MRTSPKHVAIIPDGNRRWAKKHKMLAWKGHGKGTEIFHEIADALFKNQVSHVTFWAASERNLTERSKRETASLIALLKEWLGKELDSQDLVKSEIRFRLIGRWKSILPDCDALETMVRKVEAQTERFQNRTLTILFGYDGQREMIDAIQKIKEGPKGEMSDAALRKALSTGTLPPVDLVVRTGGEPHWSAGFMMWHTANAQFAFTKTLWPEFNKNELETMLDDFSKRKRRFGK